MDNDEYGENAALAGIVDALLGADEAIAALEADRVMQLAAAMRIAKRRMARRPERSQLRQMEERSIAAEIAVATRTHDRAIQNRMNEALLLVDDFPTTLDALADGRISARHAAVIAAAGHVIADPADRARYEDTVLERALTDTVSGTKKFAERVAEELHPRSITERYAEAIEERRVWVGDRGDGTSELGLIASTVLVHGVYDRLTQQGRATKAAAVPASTDGADEADDVVHDTRTLDQIRADIATDLLLTGAPTLDPTDTTNGGLGAIRAQVSLVIPAPTAAGLHDRGCTLEGATPVDADTARTLMAGAPAWERVLTHPIIGTVMAADTYRRPAALDRYLAIRDIHCRFPGCRQPARRCDRDHTRDWALGGPTNACNLACLCKRHHTLKTETPWRPEQLPDGSIRWHTPLGRVATDIPERYVVFQPDPVTDSDPPGAPPF